MQETTTNTKVVQVQVDNASSTPKSVNELRLLAKQDKLPIQVVVRIYGKYRVFVFTTLSEARRSFPSLEPETNGNKFTWGMRGAIENKIDNTLVEALRFEDWATDEALSV